MNECIPININAIAGNHKQNLSDNILLNFMTMRYDNFDEYRLQILIANEMFDVSSYKRPLPEITSWHCCFDDNIDTSEHTLKVAQLVFL
jgi:hypothetical protein